MEELQDDGPAYLRLRQSYKTKIYVDHHYGAWEIRFEKTFDLPFPPTHNIHLLDVCDGIENTISLETNNYTYTHILYDIHLNIFYVDIRNQWKSPVTDETVDDVLEIFEKTGWKRTDRTNIKELKELMLRDYERSL